jgi:hypothetical protein
MNNSFKQKDDVKTEFHTEPVAWMYAEEYPDSDMEGGDVEGFSYVQPSSYNHEGLIWEKPLYTHPAKPIDKPDECISGCPENQTCDYCAGIKTLTDEEITFIWESCDLCGGLGDAIDFAREILIKAQNK